MCDSVLIDARHIRVGMYVSRSFFGGRVERVILFRDGGVHVKFTHGGGEFYQPGERARVVGLVV